MLARLGLGLLKGLVIGGAIGAALQYGLHWTSTAGLLGFLVSMGAAGTAGVFAGKAPWKDGAWIEALLKGMVGIGLGALAYWGIGYIPVEVPFPGLAGTHALNALPAVFAPAIAGVYGALVELDNTGDDEGSSEGGQGPRARVAIDAEEEEESPAARRRKKKRRQA